MLIDKVDYVDPGENYYNLKFKSRLINHLKLKAESYGFQLVPTPV